MKTLPIPPTPEALAKSEFLLEPGLIYLNHAALGPWPQRTVSALQQFAEENGRSASRGWRQWYATEQRLRERLSALIGAPGPQSIALLKNTSEALSQVAFGLDWRPGQAMAVLAEEFPSNLWPWQQAARQLGFSVDCVTRSPSQPIHEALIRACRRETRLIAVSSVQWASGERADLEALGDWCHEKDILLVVDGIQSAGALRTDVVQLGIDVFAFGSHKWVLAPEGVGVLYISERIRDRLTPPQAGWRSCQNPFSFDFENAAPARDARRFEIGTLNTQGIIGLEASLSLFEELGADWIESQVLASSRHLHEGLASIKGLRLAVSGPLRSGIVSFAFDEPDRTRELYRRLGEKGVMAALRCGWLRCSPHFHTPLEQLDVVLGAVRDLPS